MKNADFLESFGGTAEYEMLCAARLAANGFTLIELLVVIATMAVLAALLLPALANGSSQDQAIQCMNNCNKLVKAWTMYASDNNDKCVNNFGIAQVDYDVAQGLYSTWCLDVMDWTVNQQNTNVALLQAGLLGPYLRTSVSVFKCPADNFLSAAQISAGFSARVRSYSMNDFLGHFSDCPTCGDGGPGSGTDYTYQGMNEFNNMWPQYLKLGSIPQPSQIYVFLDEHPNSINDGYFDDGDQGMPSEPTSPPEPTSWAGSDVPASYHNGAGGFAFSDGHSEIHIWLNPGTDAPVTPGDANYPTMSFGTPPNYVDRIWLCGHACVY